MNWLGLFFILFGTAYLSYSIICSKSVTIYNKGTKIKTDNKDNFLKLQLFFALFNSAWIIILGLVVIKYNIKNINLVLTPLIFHFVNLLLKITSKKKGYIEYF